MNFFECSIQLFALSLLFLYFYWMIMLKLL